MNLFKKVRFKARGRSLRALLIALLLPGIILLLLIDSWNDYQTLADVTKDAFDAALLEPMRVLESSVDIDEASGNVVLNAPLYVQALLESRVGLRKYFSVEVFETPRSELNMLSEERGSHLAGLVDLPRPESPALVHNEPFFYDAVYRNDTVRVVVFSRSIYRAGIYRQVLVTVAESFGRRVEVELRARRKEIMRDIRMLILVAITVWWGVAWGMVPLNRLCKGVRARAPEDMAPLDPRGVAVEVLPLVDAVNYHIEKHRKVLDEQTRFLADASHQLRTPMAILLTQAQYALRERDPDRAREGLAAVVAQLRRTRRLTEQLLSLAHASQHETMPHERRDLRQLAREVILQYWPLARDKHQDLGVDESDPDEAPIWVAVSDVEIHEALANLVHNAIHYAPVGGTITVSLARTADLAEVTVIDNGPGVVPEMRERVFERFERADARDVGAAGGSGLGLAIARAYARRNGGDIVMRDGEINEAGTRGLAAVLTLPYNSRLSG